ncbi:hypothetical protein C8F04DRAFT_1330363 [Mycena alexandri]|uniref:Restriction of telomere capping protein 4 C-terminal domain-containing protein n=1 Tax=Mycena alexandri TaxID=1745969 RepID=A0AAD6RYP7_9AGAR|nr:hypothetical protein C8F04DRAFT_1330363 [Mycena alexandri]
MVRRGKTNHAEQMHDMHEEIEKQKQMIAKLQEQIARANAASKSKRLIPRPKRQAGRASGYNLQEEMLLSDDAARYNRLYRIVKDQVHQYLQVNKTISHQDKILLEKAIIQIGKVAPYFKRFEGHWPAREMISGYLLNIKGRRQRDLNLEALAESGMPGRGGEELDDSEVEAGSVHDDEEERPKKKKHKPTAKPADYDDYDASESEEDEPPKRKKSSTSAKPRPSTHRKFDEDEDEFTADEAPTKKKAQGKPPNSNNKKSGGHNKSKNNSSSSSLSAALYPKSSYYPTSDSDLPSWCYVCDEEIPATPNKRLSSLFRRRDELITKVGPRGEGVEPLELQICAAITQEKTIALISLVSLDGSTSSPKPSMIWFKTQLFSKNPSCGETFVLTLEGVFSIFQIQRPRSASRMQSWDDDAARPVYHQREPPRYVFQARGISQHSLFETLHDIVLANPRLFDAYDETSNLVDLETFLCFLLTPFTANLLISEDLDIDVTEADDVRNESNDYGEAMHPEDDEDADVPPPSPKSNPKHVKRETPQNSLKRLRFISEDAEEFLHPEQSNTASSSKRTQTNDKKRTALSVDDFEEPRPKKQVKLEKPKAKAVERKPKGEPSVKKEPIKSNYGTRSKTR